MPEYHSPDNTYPHSQPAQSASHTEELLFYWPQHPVDDTLTIEYAQSLIAPDIKTNGLLSIVGGTLATLASLGFLIFLWTGQGTTFGAVGASPSWRAIILRGWASQAITLAALLIRTATAIQATTCTGMLAALFLERHYIPKSEVVHFSILRSGNNGPLRLAELASKLRPISCWFSIETALLLSLLTSALALQFASTILFIDVHDFTIAANVGVVPVNDYIVQYINLFTPPKIVYQPQTYAAFGELPSNTSSSPDTKGFSTSGLRRRAFIPLREAINRTAIHSYNGNAPVLSSNIACMPPMMQGTILRDPKSYEEDGASESFASGLTIGTLNYGESLREARGLTSLCNSEGCFSAGFNCTIPGADARWPGWSSSFCFIDVVGGDQWHKPTLLDWDSVVEPWSNHSFIYLVFHTNMYADDWDASRNPRSLDAAATTTAEEWRSYEIKKDRVVEATLCFSNFYAALSSVDMVATGKLVEPLGNCSITGVSDSSAVRKYLGITKENYSYADRGILTIKNMSSPAKFSPVESGAGTTAQPNQTSIETILSQYNYGLYNNIVGQRNDSLLGCTRCNFYGTTVHPELAVLIQDTINETGRAVDALQGYTTTFANTFYNEFLKAFTGAENFRISFTKTLEVPGGCEENGCKGLFAVVGLVAFHLLCVFVTVITYIKFTRYSRHGNAWHAVSQLMGAELATMLDRGNDMGDDELREEMEKEKNNSLVRLEKRKNGKIDFVRMTEEFE
ncbi:hypothetical protein F5Y12DRAFT_798658 [Xylaria sp. FL1777]|nr:hypothetical protein F5Y12DRAFT_798658 [Xylaria sp. FL1777]